MNKLVITILASSLLLFTGRIAGAQIARARIADTPVRGEANLASAVIATLKEGGAVDVVADLGDWYRVLVPDEQGSPRVGYVPAHLIEIVTTDGSAQSILPTSRAAQPVAQGPQIAPTLAQLALQRDKEMEHAQALRTLALERDKAAEREQALRAEVDALKADPNARQHDQPVRQVPSGQIPKRAAPHSQTREGFWFNAGLGFGSLCFDECIGRRSGLSGGLSLGRTINDRVLLGIGTTGYYRSVNGTAANAGTLDARVRFYPVRTSGFFLTGGLGLGHISVANNFASETEYGIGLVLGLGWDIRVRPKLSVTPFWNGIGIATSSANTSVGQLGLSITVH